MMIRFRRLPIRHSLLLMVLLAFMLATLASLLISLQQSRSKVIAAATHHAESEVVTFARVAENQLAAYRHDVQRFVMLHAAEEEDFEVTMTVLLDPHGRVITAFRSDWTGRALGDVMPGWDSRRLERVQRGAHHDLLIEGDTLSLVEPFDYPRMGNELASNQKGAVYVAYDLRPAFVAARNAELQHHLPHVVTSPAGIFAAGLVAEAQSVFADRKLV